jgi:hypothetical protein
VTKTLKELCDSISRELVVAKDYTGDPTKDAVRISNHLFHEVNEFLHQYDLNRLYSNVADTAIAEKVPVVQLPVAPTEDEHYVVPTIAKREVTPMIEIQNSTREAAAEKFREGKKRALREMKNDQDKADRIVAELFRESSSGLPEPQPESQPEPPPGFRVIQIPTV